MSSTPLPRTIDDDGAVSEATEQATRRRIYVTGHRNPDMDSIASAIGYAELKGRLDSQNEYVPVRLGEPNAQTAWALERAGCPEPDLMNHVFLRVSDVMREGYLIGEHTLRPASVAVGKQS